MPRPPQPFFMFFLLAVVLTACRDRAEATPAAAAGTPPPAAPESIEPIATTASRPTPTPQRVRGNALMGKDGYGITPCGEQAQRIIGLSGQAQSMIDQFVAGGAREFFIDGWAAPSAGTGATLQRIERVYTEGPGCTEAPDATLLVARGNEPFWNLAVARDGLTLQRPDQQALVVSGVSLESVAGGHRLDVQTPAGQLLLRVTPEPCSDGMSDTLYGSTAKLTIGQLAYDGCAFAGGGAKPD